MKLESLKLRTQYVGNLTLELTEQVGWKSFPDFAMELLNHIGGEVVYKGDTVVDRLWEVEIESCTIRLFYQDYPLMISLESKDKCGDKLIKRLYEQLKAIGD